MSGTRTVSRREVLKGTAVATAAGALGPFFPGRVLGANDRINIAICGVRSRGGSHIANFSKIQGVRIKTFVDIDENVLGKKIADFQKANGYAPGAEHDMRKAFDDKEIDAVSFATPNHWHALGAIWAAQAKKNVYVEKPACHTIFEGRQMVNAARKNNVLMQVGFQSRSRRNVRAAIDFLHSGKLGKVYMARGLCYKPRVNIGRVADGPQAEGSKSVPGGGGPYTASYLEKVHYDLWIGPGPQRPFNPNRFHYNWHWQWPYGNGDTGNQGPHQFDVGRWGLNKDEHPVRVRSFGGVYVWQDTQQETPNTQSSVLEYADGTIFEFETRGLLTNADGKQKIGVIFYGSDGRLEIGEGGEWQVYVGKNDELGPNSKNYEDAKDKGDAMNLAGAGDSGHFANFVAALKSGKQTDLNCDIEVGFRSTVLPHLCNISYRLDRELKWDGKKEQFVGDADANKLLHRQDRKGFQIPNLGGPKTA